VKFVKNTYASLLFAKLSFLQGMASTLDLGGNLTTYNFSSSPDEADRDALAHDWFVVGNDLREVMINYGEPL